MLANDRTCCMPPLRLQALQAPCEKLTAAVALMNRVHKVTLENSLLHFVPLALGQLFNVLHGHKVCLHLICEADIAALCIVSLTTSPDGMRMLLTSGISRGWALLSWHPDV